MPGGGSVAALSGALASALGAMVARLTVGKKNYEASWAEMERVAADLSAAREGFTADIDRDSEAYDRVFACFKMPKATDEEKAARSAAIQEATRQAALVPMEVARKAFALMPALAYVARNGNRNAVTDACVAMMSARNAVLGALLNVRINLGSLKDKEFVAALQAEATTSSGKPATKKPVCWNPSPKNYAYEQERLSDRFGRADLRPPRTHHQ